MTHRVGEIQERGSKNEGWWGGGDVCVMWRKGRKGEGGGHVICDEGGGDDYKDFGVNIGGKKKVDMGRHPNRDDGG